MLRRAEGEKRLYAFEAGFFGAGNSDVFERRAVAAALSQRRLLLRCQLLTYGLLLSALLAVSLLRLGWKGPLLDSLRRDSLFLLCALWAVGCACRLFSVREDGAETALLAWAVLRQLSLALTDWWVQEQAVRLAEVEALATDPAESMREFEQLHLSPRPKGRRYKQLQQALSHLFRRQEFIDHAPLPRLTAVRLRSDFDYGHCLTLRARRAALRATDSGFWGLLLCAATLLLPKLRFGLELLIGLSLATFLLTLFLVGWLERLTPPLKNAFDFRLRPFDADRQPPLDAAASDLLSGLEKGTLPPVRRGGKRSLLADACAEEEETPSAVTRCLRERPLLRADAPSLFQRCVWRVSPSHVLSLLRLTSALGLCLPPALLIAAGSAPLRAAVSLLPLITLGALVPVALLTFAKALGPLRGAVDWEEVLQRADERRRREAAEVLCAVKADFLSKQPGGPSLLSEQLVVRARKAFRSLQPRPDLLLLPSRLVSLLNGCPSPLLPADPLSFAQVCTRLNGVLCLSRLHRRDLLLHSVPLCTEPFLASAAVAAWTKAVNSPQAVLCGEFRFLQTGAGHAREDLVALLLFWSCFGWA